MLPEYKLSSAENLEQQYQNNILPFWQERVKSGLFYRPWDVAIAYAYCITPHAKATIVISPGRTESYLKYQELFYDLCQNGYSVFAIDHRGQGFSDRLMNNDQKGYVDEFQEYVDDFAQFINEEVKPKTNNPLFLVGHSMGATIATLYLEQYPDTFVASAMSAPLYGFNPGLLPIFIAKPLCKIFIGFKKLIRKPLDYFIGQRDFRFIPFKDNKLTHCQPRYKQFNKLYAQHSELRLGGITSHWLDTSLSAIKGLFKNIDEIETPVLIIQSFDDEVVNLADQTRFYKRLAAKKLCEKIELHGAKHEVFFETDLMRTTAITDMLKFFDRHLKRPQLIYPQYQQHQYD